LQKTDVIIVAWREGGMALPLRFPIKNQGQYFFLQKAFYK